MRETRTAQTSIFDFYSEHKTGKQLEALSNLLDKHQSILVLLKEDVLNGSRADTGRNGLTVESIFRCLLLKQMLGVSYEQLAFHLSDSLSYRTFARLARDKSPSKTALQTNIRRISSDTLKAVFDLLAQEGFKSGDLGIDLIRIDSTVVKSNIAVPSDSKLLYDSVRVLSRLMAQSRKMTGLKIRFKDYRKAAKSLAFKIFNGKKTEKDALYIDLLSLSNKVIEQVEQSLIKVKEYPFKDIDTDNWFALIQHYNELALQVIDQTERRVVFGEKVPSSEKIVSLFEEHTDIIVKGKRDVEYGHKINVASDERGLLTYVAIEKGNPSDAEQFISILTEHKHQYDIWPKVVVSDGCYASQANVKEGRELGVKQVVFNKKRGIGLRQMGIKQKTYDTLKNFRAGVEGNISELKRVFGLGKATWKGQDGFHAYVWTSAIAYNLVRLVRLEPG